MARLLRQAGHDIQASGRRNKMQRIAGLADLEQGLDALCRIDMRLSAVRASAGPVPLRLIEPGFESLASIVMAQMVSRASADAIFARLRRLIDPLSPTSVLAAPDNFFREAGLSRAKHRAVLGIASAVEAGLDLAELATLGSEEAILRLTAIPGVGAWTAECYLLFACGHPDIFPDGDVALQTAAGHALGISPRPEKRELAALAGAWAPWRSVAARLLWAYYSALKGGREAAPAVQLADRG